METSLKNVNETFTFSGLWGMESKCGVKIHEKGGKYIVIVTELYLDNPGTSVTQAASLLVEQICSRYELNPEQIVYIEHNPDMNSKLSFYNEEYYKVEFHFENGKFSSPKYRLLSSEEVDRYITQ